MIVVATADFEIYHEVVTLLRRRGATFTTVEPGDALPEETAVVITGQDDPEPAHDAVVRATPDEPRAAVTAAIEGLRTTDGRTVVGVDPGERPGIAVLVGDTVVAAFQVPLEDAAERVRSEVEGAIDPVVRIGDGARLQGAKLVNALEDVPVELVDESGTTPYLGAGARRVGDILAAVNIARREGEPVEHRDVTPTAGELQVIQDRSRDASPANRAIDEDTARLVATGELSLEEAMARHADDSGPPPTDAEDGRDDG